MRDAAVAVVAGEETQAAIRQILATPKDVIERVKMVLGASVK